MAGRSGDGGAVTGPDAGATPARRWLRRFVREHPALDRSRARGIAALRGAVGSRRPLASPAAPRPVLIVGAGRSGNTVLRRVLMASMGVHFPPESYVLGPLTDVFQRYSYHPWPWVVDAVIGTFARHPEFVHWDLPLDGVAGELRDEREDQSLARIIDAVYRAHGLRHTGRAIARWGDKTPINAFYLHRLHAVFPEAAVIHMIRDGADVIQSYVASGLMRDPAQAATRWSSAVRAVQRFQRTAGSPVVDVRYEAFVNDPGGVAAGVAGELGLSFDVGGLNHVPELGDVSALDHHRNVTKPIEPSSIGKGRQAMSASDRAALASTVNPLLVELGYEPL